MMSPNDLRFFADYIHKELGIVYQQENYFQLEKRLTEVIRVMGLKDEEALVQKARMGMDGAFKQVMLDLATNNETSFFRDAKIFSAIEKHVVPKIIANPKFSGTIRIWCAASSFGQEPYSLAMTLTEMRKKNPAFPRFEIVATDISENALKRAKAANYTQLEVQRGLAPELLTRYFTLATDGTYNVGPEVKNTVSYKKQNLLDSFSSLGTFDLVLCRNVLIYQKDESKREIIRRISMTMNPNAFLFLGAAESLM
ncbi:MAG: protein-glutamate O-methyltransferase CheR, partial [Proteobacteria bacterium]